MLVPRAPVSSLQPSAKFPFKLPCRADTVALFAFRKVLEFCRSYVNFMRLAHCAGDPGGGSDTRGSHLQPPRDPLHRHGRFRPEPHRHRQFLWVAFRANCSKHNPARGLPAPGIWPALDSNGRNRTRFSNSHHRCRPQPTPCSGHWTNPGYSTRSLRAIIVINYSIVSTGVNTNDSGRRWEQAHH